MTANLGWPSVRALGRQDLCALLDQLDASQWWSPEELRRRQFGQLTDVIRHAREQAPFYKERFETNGLKDAALDEDALAEMWGRIPLLTRRDIQTAGSSLHAALVPPSHGAVGTINTSGSTAQPVAIRKTTLESLFWSAFTIRDHLWHARDFKQSMAAIRFAPPTEALPPDGKRARDWGRATRLFVRTGPGYLLNVRATIAEQADWLARIRPGYILGYPSAMRALAEYLSARSYQLPKLREIRTFGEIVESECRAACREAFGVSVCDGYSSQEVGYIALQCPRHEHYHVQSEGVFVEVLRADNQPCGIGEVGRVVVTNLHNYAMPLIRYDIGDYAEVGPPCDCGRGLPLLTRILGRQRNILILPNGQQRWPALGQGTDPQSLPPFFQFQVVQRTLQRIEVRVVRPVPFTVEESTRVCKYIQQTLGHPFEVTIEYVDSIDRSPSGKFEDFVSNIGN
jgi:phenylacetate-CoA ligase